MHQLLFCLNSPHGLFGLSFSRCRVWASSRSLLQDVLSDNTFKITWNNEDAYFCSGTLGESDCSSLMSSRHNEVIRKTGDGSRLLLRALSPFLRPGLSALPLNPGPAAHLWSTEGLLLPPSPSQAPVIDDHQRAQYCTIFQFPALEEEFKGLSEVQRHSVVPAAHKQPPHPHAEDPEIQTPSREHSRNQVLPVSTKQPLPPSSCLTDSSAEDTDRKLNSLWECNITKTRGCFIQKCSSVCRVGPVCLVVDWWGSHCWYDFSLQIQFWMKMYFFWKCDIRGTKCFYLAIMGFTNLLFGHYWRCHNWIDWINRPEFVFAEHKNSFLTLNNN